ncbi:CoA transferase [Arthrobacter silvisoli]|uniref:CoA transferase n=1 Tax=Arthrobacter silvisoli TaxID=2291022 RepID=UPI000E2138B9|nr:CoA transferase [Arthrobacter silvisoli]
MEAVPDLASSLRVLDALRSAVRAQCSGPRQWWSGALDVEGLAMGAVQATATALNALTESGRYSASSTRVAAAFDSLGHLRIDGRHAEGFAPISGFRRTADGWIRLHANYPHHAERLMRALNVSTPGDVDIALSRVTADDAEALITSHHGAAAVVRTRDAWTSTAMRAAVASGPWISFTASVPSRVRGHTWIPAPGGVLPLAGLRVLDLTRVIAGPVATRLLGALGADVLRIDPPALPELADAFIDTGFDKRSAEADLAAPGVLGRVEELIASADVFISGYRGGALERFGLDPESLRERWPGLVVGTLDAWGSEGPWSGRRGFDSLVQAASGIAVAYGTNDDGFRPGALPVQALDHATGYGVAAAVLALLAERHGTRAGGSARLSLARTAEELFALPATLLDSQGSGSAPDPALSAMDSPYGSLRHVGPPLLADGVPLKYRRPPAPYGSSALGWQVSSEP